MSLLIWVSYFKLIKVQRRHEATLLKKRLESRARCYHSNKFYLWLALKLSIFTQELVMVAIELSEQMIIFDRCLESWLDSTQKSYQKPHKEGSFTYAVHFLIGSFCSDGDIHVAHASLCPLPATAADGVSSFICFLFFYYFFFFLGKLLK